MAKHGLSGDGRYHSGFYKLVNPNKYIDNPNEPIMYRSGWEYKFMVYCDMTPEILRWGSEVFKINYIDVYGKSRYYMPDFYLETASEKHPGIINKFLIEIKPEKEIREPVIPKSSMSAKKIQGLEYQVQTWFKNKHKWAYASEWCKNRDIRFWLVTEKHLAELNILVPKK